MLQFFRTILITVVAIAFMWFPGEAAIALGGPQPELNQLAPEFTLLGNDGEGEIQEFSLQDYRGQWVVLYFYPQDFTPGCTLEARRFQQDLPKYLERNVQVLGVSVDDVDSHEAFCDAEGLKFPLLADSTGDVSKQYGSYLTGYSLRHTYLIDPEGILRKIYLGVNPAIHSQEVLTDLDSLMANSSAQLPPMG
ncbi:MULTISPECIES: peroxiredoxin [Cyanophyceae]|uniref:peroxiredoxin n=2 Tax=Cyanophyceae TaxID=3028117 RepID=UPI0004AB7E40|nr:peroxiredoxin [Synechococcus sp. BDU 130192]AMA07951.1 AhpC/TSA family protein [Picosynechococcus sp. PCC 73109]ANV86094.1 AhpC/TSA family protein [Picosynechococcus sp. PCC 7117]QCS48772.1 peroxiredoxin [Picosynechococcus sp. PCC 11901]